jgi:hypothetical protein
MDSTAEGHSSVAPKLLHDMQSQCLAGMRLVQHLQVGCLMGCLTHLSLAGEAPFKICPCSVLTAHMPFAQTCESSPEVN